MPENWEYREILKVLDIMVDIQDRLANADIDDWEYANEIFKIVLPTKRAREAHKRRLRKYQEDAALVGRALGVDLPNWRQVTPRVFHTTLIPLFSQIASLKRIEPDWNEK